MTEYTKTATMKDVDTALLETLAAEHIGGTTLYTELLNAGVTVKLKDGLSVWVSCVPFDDPTTHNLEMLAIGIAGGPDGPLKRPNGRVVAMPYTFGVTPVQLLDADMSAIRKAAMRVVLGLEPEEDGFDLGLNSLEERRQRSIRTAVALYDGVRLPREDVL